MDNKNNRAFEIELQEKIEAFLEIWPNAEFGPAHIVLSDYNLRNVDIIWSINLIHAALAKSMDGLDLDERDLELLQALNWYSDCTKDELKATQSFLNELLQIPEDIREVYEDDEYGF